PQHRATSSACALVTVGRPEPFLWIFSQSSVLRAWFAFIRAANAASVRKLLIFLGSTMTGAMDACPLSRGDLEMPRKRNVFRFLELDRHLYAPVPGFPVFFRFERPEERVVHSDVRDGFVIRYRRSRIGCGARR